MLLLDWHSGCAALAWASRDRSAWNADAGRSIAVISPRVPSHFEGVADMRYIILWALGVPVLALVALHLLGIL